MAITGKSTLSLKRQDVKEQKSISFGTKKIQFAHKATLGDTGINLGALVLPTEMSGFTNPSPTELLSAQLFFYRKNFTLISSIRGVLIDYMSYNVPSSTQVSFNGFTAADGEIFTGIIDASARTGVNLVDAAPLVSTGELAISATDFNVGQMFEINKYSSSQVGAVIVYRNGTQQFRNTNNSSVTLDGNYYEVNNGSGTGQVIRFNTAPSGTSDSILVVSNGLMAYNPDGSALQMIESLSGKVDSMVPTLATLAGVPEGDFGGVANVDLKSFGDTVLTNRNRIVTLEETLSLTATTAFAFTGAGANIWSDLAFLDLTSGEWDIDVYATMDSNAVALGSSYLGLSSTAGDVAPGTLGPDFVGQTWSGSAGDVGALAFARKDIVVSGTQRWYAKAMTNAAGGRAGCRLMARRIKKG